MKRRTCRFRLFLPLFFIAPLAFPQALVDAYPHLRFTTPVFLTAAPDSTNRVYVVQQNGRIKVFTNDSTTAFATTFLDVSHALSDSTGEEGLLGLAFDPDFRKNGYYYVNYTLPAPLRSRIARFTVAAGRPDSTDPASQLTILEVNQPFPNHKAGMLAFGPDSDLYIGFGDGGGAGDPFNNAQNPQALLGKILRIDVRHASVATPYLIPPDNPFVGMKLVAREEIWAMGLRNPWRFSFDSLTLWAGDVGQDLWEEVDIIRKGGNYGWNRMEGFASYPPGSTPPDTSQFTPPIKVYSHALGNAIVGGYVYRGSVRPDLVGAYIYGDYGSGRIWMLRYQDGHVLADSLVVQYPGTISSFGVDQRNELYVAAISGGPTSIYRFAARKLTAIKEAPVAGLPRSYSLEQNYPNPFNPSTTIRYATPQRSHVTIDLFNALGQKVTELVNGDFDAGSYEVHFDAGNLASGIYFYRLSAVPLGPRDLVPGNVRDRRAGAFTVTRVMHVVK